MPAHWRDSLRPASWRGVPFEVAGSEMEFGRRLVQHEYPGRDVGLVEDMGRGIRRISLAAFVVGSDYHVKRDALIAAAEAPGAGVLIHPYHGRIVCSCEILGVSESSEDGGIASLRLTFVEAGDRVVVVPSVATSGAVGDAADAARLTAGEVAFGALDYADRPGWVLDRAQGKNQEVIAAVVGAVRPWAAVCGDFAGLVESMAVLASEPPTSGEAWADALGDAFGLIGVYDAARAAAAAIGAAVETPQTSSTPDGLADEANRAAVGRVYRRGLLAEACALAVAESWSSRDAALEVRDDLADALSDEIEAGDDLDAAAFAALVDLRTGMAAALDDAAAELPPLRTYAIPGVVSVLDLAQTLYQSGSRADELEALLGSPHPGFVSGAIRVVSR